MLSCTSKTVIWSRNYLKTFFFILLQFFPVFSIDNWFISFCDSFYMNNEAPILIIKSSYRTHKPNFVPNETKFFHYCINYKNWKSRVRRALRFQFWFKFWQNRLVFVPLNFSAFYLIFERSGLKWWKISPKKVKLSGGNCDLSLRELTLIQLRLRECCIFRYPNTNFYVYRRENYGNMNVWLWYKFSWIECGKIAAGKTVSKVKILKHMWQVRRQVMTPLEVSVLLHN